jgi:Protein of unknown function (DUF4244)
VVDVTALDEEADGDVVEVGVERASVRRTAARWCQRGMVSAEWAVGIIAAVALAGVLIAVVTHGQVRNALLKFVIQVIHSFSGYVQ